MPRSQQSKAGRTNAHLRRRPSRRAGWSPRCQSRRSGLKGGPRSPFGGAWSVQARESAPTQRRSGRPGRRTSRAGGPGCCCWRRLPEMRSICAIIASALVSQPAKWNNYSRISSSYAVKIYNFVLPPGFLPGHYSGPWNKSRAFARSGLRSKFRQSAISKRGL